MFNIYRGKWAVCLNAIMILLIVLASGISPVKGSTVPEEWTLVGQFGGSTQAVAVSGNIAYTGIGLRMSAVDFSNPSDPKLLGMSSAFSDMVLDIAVQDKTAYIASGSAGLQIVDISDPSRPITLGSWQSSGFAEGVAVKDNTVFLANGDQGLSIINVSDPRKPVQIASAYSFNYAFDVVVSGDFTYIAAGDSGLLILDTSKLAKPAELSQLDTQGYAYELALSENYIFLADAWEGVQVIDVSKPLKPALASTIKTSGWSLGVSVADDLLVSANGGQGMQFFNVAQPAQPKLKSQFIKAASEGDAMVRRALLVGDLVLAADTINGLRLVDISMSMMPKQAGIYGQLSYARRVAIKGDYAYVATAGEGVMYAVNIADPRSPYQVSKFQADGIAIDVVLNGDYATLGTFEDATNCYTLINVSDPLEPQLSDAVDLQSLLCGAPRQMAAQGNFVYSADEWGLSIYDLTQPGSIKTIGRVELQQEGDQTLALSVVGDYAYVADSASGLKIVDVSDPADPKLVQVLKDGNTVGSIFGMGDLLYLGYYGEGLAVAKNPNPGSLPSVLEKYKTKGSVEEITAANDILIVSEGSGGLEILDASDPADLKLVQSVSTPGFAWASVLSGDHIYVADSAAGLLIYEKLPAGQPVDEPSNNGKPNAYPSLTVSGITKGPESKAPNYVPAGEKVTGKAVCKVTSSADSGSGSLRDCLASVQPGETILFDAAVFPPKNPVIIALQSPLPALESGSITIDASNAGVILDGQNQVPAGLVSRSTYNTIMGIQFVNFPMDGITLEFPSEYNQIGGDHTIGSGPSGQGNVFSGCFNGIRVLFARYNTIKGNFVGTNAAGTQAARPNSLGIVLGNYAVYNTVGGPTAGEKNIISNNDRGVDIAANSAAFNMVAGNYVGTDITGTKAIPNTSWGILIEVGGRNNVIGGTAPEERNIISGNYTGVMVSDYASSQNSIIGNYIGLDVSGTKALPNQSGTGVFQSMYNRFGGTRPGEGNVISGNSGNGVRFFGMGPVHAILMGNLIGLDASGKKPVGNNLGLWLDGGTHSMIGGLGEAAANDFANNALSIGVENAGTSHNWLAGNRFTGGSQAAPMFSKNASNNCLVKNSITKNSQGITIVQAVGNTLRANSISANTAFGIELRDGGNLGLNAPVINQVNGGTVSGTACAGCLVEVFSDAANQGQTYEGYTVADTSGNFIFSGELTGPNITATATDSAGNTSQFSKAMPVSK